MSYLLEISTRLTVNLLQQYALISQLQLATCFSTYTQRSLTEGRLLQHWRIRVACSLAQGETRQQEGKAWPFEWKRQSMLSRRELKLQQKVKEKHQKVCRLTLSEELRPHLKPAKAYFQQRIKWRTTPLAEAPGSPDLWIRRRGGGGAQSLQNPCSICDGGAPLSNPSNE